MNFWKLVGLINVKKGANIFIFMCVFKLNSIDFVERFNYLNKTFPRLTGATDWHLGESLNNCSTKSSVES